MKSKILETRNRLMARELGIDPKDMANEIRKRDIEHYGEELSKAKAANETGIARMIQKRIDLLAMLIEESEKVTK